MSVSNPRQKSAFAPIKPDISVPLDVQREHSRLRLKSAWDSIIERYSQEFDDDDEIDLLTEEIIVDRGFLRNQPIRKIGTLTKYMEEYEDEESSETDSESDSESESDEESADNENQENIDQLPDEIAPASKYSGRKKSKKSSKSKADKEDDDQENDDVYDDIFLNLVNSTKGKFSKLKYTPKSRVSMDGNRSVNSATSVLETAKHTIDELIYDCDEELKVEVEKTLLNAATVESNISENENNTTLDNTEIAVVKKGFSSRKTTVKKTVTPTIDRTKRNYLKSKSSKLRSRDSSQSDSDYAEERKGRAFQSKLPNSPPTTIHDDSETESDPSLQQYYQSKPRRRGRPPKSRPISDATRLKSAKSPQESTDDIPRRRGRPPNCRPTLDAARLKSVKCPQESTDDTESEVGSDTRKSHPVTVKRKRHNITDITSKRSKIKAFENSENTEPKSKKSKISVAKLTGEDTSVAGRQRKSSKQLELKPSGQSETTDSDSDFASFSASVSKTKLKVKNHQTRSPMHRVEKSKPMNAKSIRKTLEELGVTTSTTFPEYKKCPSPRSLLSPHRTRHSKSSSSPHKKRLSIVSEQACSVSSAQISQDCDYDEYQPHSAEFEHDEHGSPKELSTSTLISSSDTTSIVAGLSCAEISCNDDATSAEESVVSQQIECDYDGGLISGPGEEDEEDQCRSGPEDEDELSESERLAQENRKSNQYDFRTHQYPQICKKRRQFTSHFPSTQQHSNHRHPSHHPPQYNHPFQSSGPPHLPNYFSHFNPFPYPSPYYQFNPILQPQFPQHPYPSEDQQPGHSTHKHQSHSDHSQDEDHQNEHFSNSHQHHANHIHSQHPSSNQQTHQPQHPQPSTYTVPITVQVPLQMPYPHFPAAAAVPPIQVNQIHQHHYTLNTINNHNDKALIYNGSGNPEQLLNLAGSRSLTGVDGRAALLGSTETNQ